MKRLAPSVAILVLAGCADSPVAPTISVREPLLAKSSVPKGRIVFFSEGDLYSMNPDGTVLTLLTAGPFGGHEPEWSPKAPSIAFTDDRFVSSDVFVMHEDGTAVTRLTIDLADDRSPSWSPDGRLIAYASTVDGDFEIFVMNADGSGVTQL